MKKVHTREDGAEIWINGTFVFARHPIDDKAGIWVFAVFHNCRADASAACELERQKQAAQAKTDEDFEGDPLAHDVDHAVDKALASRAIARLPKTQAEFFVRELLRKYT